MFSIFDNILDTNPALNHVIIAVLIGCIAVSFAFMLRKKSVPIILGMGGLILIYLYAWDTLPTVYGAIGFIIIAILIVVVIKGGKE